MTSPWAVNVRGLVITAICHKPTLSHYSGTIVPVLRNWQFAVKWCPTCHSGKHFFRFIFCRNIPVCPRGSNFWWISVSILGWILIFFDSSESLKELPQFVVRTFSLWVKLESELLQNPPDLRTWIYINRCPTQGARTLKRKKGLANLSSDLSSVVLLRPKLKPLFRDTVPGTFSWKKFVWLSL
jgi:hypothetical protein